MSMRKEFLRGYLFALVTEGEFANVKGVRALVATAVSAFARDAASVAGEFVPMALEQGVHRLGTAVLSKMDQIAKDVGKRGFGPVWADLQETYKRGMDANARRK